MTNPNKDGLLQPKMAESARRSMVFAFPCSFGVVVVDLSSPLKGQPNTPVSVGFEAPHFAGGANPLASFFGNSSHWAEAAVRECISDLDAVAFMAAAFFLFLI